MQIESQNISENPFREVLNFIEGRFFRIKRCSRRCSAIITFRLIQVFNYITRLVLKSKKAQQQKADEDKGPGGIKLDKSSKKKKKGGCC